MTIEHIVEALNLYKDKEYPNTTYYFLSQKLIQPNPTFPAYKEFSIILNVMDKGALQKELLKVSMSEKALNKEQEQEVWNKLGIQFLIKLFENLYYDNL